MTSILDTWTRELYTRPVRNRLRELRAERRWSQADLGERLGVSRQTINAIETERYDPSLPLAFRMAALFGCPIERIFEPDAP
jgi:putative transcriptional regulator